jgi:hypothetical protein
VELCIEKRLDCELDGVNIAFELGGDDCGLEIGKWELLGEGVLPYGCALLKLYAGGR